MRLGRLCDGRDAWGGLQVVSHVCLEDSDDVGRATLRFCCWAAILSWLTIFSVVAHPEIRADERLLQPIPELVVDELAPEKER